MKLRGFLFIISSLLTLTQLAGCGDGFHVTNDRDIEFDATDAGGAVTHKDVIPMPPAPGLPRAGGVYADPAFGTSILRVTDESDGSDCGVAYSYWPSFNANSTRIQLRCNGQGLLYDFDPNGFRLGAKRPLFEGATSAGTVGNAEDAIWSSGQSDVLFAHDGRRLWSYDVSLKSYSLIADLGASMAAGHNIFQMSKSQDDNVFAWTEKNGPPDYQSVGFIVYSRNQNRVIHHVDDVSKLNIGTSRLDEVQIDKTGRYLLVKTGLENPGQVRLLVIDLASGHSTSLRAGSPELACGHSDNGAGVSIGIDNFTNSVQRRALGNPSAFSDIINFGNDWSQAHHVSALAADEGWALISAYSSNREAGLFHGEIFQVATDGSQRVRRLGHHRSVYKDYYDTPRANISRDGKFVAYTSNWDGSGVRSVFVLKVPGGESSPTPSNPAPAPNDPAPAPGTGAPPPPASGSHILLPGQVLQPGQSLISPNGRYRLSYQGDGNLVIYRSDWSHTWSTHTFGAGFAAMQGDGNFVIYNSRHRPLWASNTVAHPGGALVLQDDGNLVIYANGHAVWATDTNE